MTELNVFWFYGLDNASEQFHKLYWRLLKAEQHGEELSYKLIRMLEKLKGLNNTRANLTFSNSSRNALGNSSGKYDLSEGQQYLLTLTPSLTQRLSLSLPARHFFQLDALLYLPHLRQSDDSLQPRVHLGQGRSGGQFLSQVEFLQLLSER